MKLDIKKLREGRMEVKKREVLARELFTANVDNCFYNNGVHCVSLSSETHSACTETIHIAISLFFHWKNPKMRMFA